MSKIQHFSACRGEEYFTARPHPSRRGGFSFIPVTRLPHRRVTTGPARLHQYPRGTKLAQHAQNTPKPALFRQQGEFCLGPTQNPLLPGKFHLAHGRRSQALRSLRLPPHRRCLVAGVWLGASSRSPARPRHSPRASQISRVKPASPLLARARVGLKPPSLLRVRNGRF